jgi:hypothetical protein
LVRLAPQEEQAIIEVTRDLISKLGVHKLDPNTATTSRARGQGIQIYRDRVVLPLALCKNLTLEEWRPLIASQLNYSRNLDKKRMLVAFSYQVFSFATIPIGLALGFAFGILPVPEPAASGFILLWIILMIPVAKILYSPFFRRLQQTADRQTRDLFMNPNLENVLQKIETMNRQGSKRNKAIERRISGLRGSS